ncbi:hypothetical protein HMPREF9946_04790 [Acetobacteraceae bacterium AT-5844]|nr:hypothetical protein HMPREF9946_04790 [Acetobacteraceae bacterium AT-5844]
MSPIYLAPPAAGDPRSLSGELLRYQLPSPGLTADLVLTIHSPPIGPALIAAVSALRSNTVKRTSGTT